MTERHRLLLVEDDPGDAEFVQEALNGPSGEGFEISCAERLSRAVELLERDHPDLVLLDLSLPDAQGLETFRALQKKDPEVPIIVLTGLDDEEMGMNAVQCGAQDYLVKSSLTDPTAFLRRVIRYAIERHRVLVRLREASLRDELTGLYNRRGFYTLAEQQVKLARRKGTGMVLLFADLDGLKGINDQHGHRQGDRALIRAAEILRATFRDSDILARIGGDEFVVLAIEATPDDVEIMLARLRGRQEVSNADPGQPFPLSLSLGSASFDPTDSSLTIDHLIARADEALYRSRATRRRSSRPLRAPAPFPEKHPVEK